MKYMRMQCITCQAARHFAPPRPRPVAASSIRAVSLRLKTMVTTITLSRDTAILQLEDLTARVCQCVHDGDMEAIDLLMAIPSRPGDKAEEAAQLTMCGGGAGIPPNLSRLTQLWVVIGVLYGIVTKGKKLTQASHTTRPPPSRRFAHLHYVRAVRGSASSGTASSRQGCSRAPKRSTGGYWTCVPC